MVSVRVKCRENRKAPSSTAEQPRAALSCEGWSTASAPSVLSGVGAEISGTVLARTTQQKRYHLAPARRINGRLTRTAGGDGAGRGREARRAARTAAALL